LHIKDNYKDNRRDNKYLTINHRNKVSSMLNQSDQLSLGEGNKYQNKVKTLYQHVRIRENNELKIWICAK